MLGLLLFLAAPAHLSADRVELTAHEVRAEGRVSVRVEGLFLEAPALSAVATEACPEGELRVSGPATLVRGPARVTAGALSLCLPAGLLTAEDVRITAPRLRIAARAARMTGGDFEVSGVSASACACEDPPWRVTASQAEGAVGEGIWASWPVLWAGPVPVATAPRWYFPLARRRTGFLLPELGWHGDDGPWGRLPFFWALHQSLDTTLAPGFRAARGPTLDARTRWAASETEGGQLDASLLADEGVALAGDGTLPVGPARFAVDGAAATTRTTRLVLGPTLAEARRDHLRGQLGASVAGAYLGTGARAVVLQDLRASGDDLIGQPGARTPLPAVWAGWTVPLGPATLQLDAEYARLEVAGPKDVDRLDMAIGGDATLWAGPLRLRPMGGVASTWHGAREASGQRLVGFAAAEAELGVGRQFGALRHEVTVQLDGRAADEGVVNGAPDALEPFDRPVASQRVAATLSNRLVGRALRARLDLVAAYEAAAPVEGVEPPVAALTVDDPRAGATAAVAADEAVWARARFGQAARLELGLTRLRLTRRTPWLRDVGAIRPLAYATDAGDLTTADARGWLPLGRWRLGYGLAVDAEAPHVLGQDGEIAYAGRCDCWSARLTASHVRGRPAPDVWLSVALAPPR